MTAEEKAAEGPRHECEAASPSVCSSARPSCRALLAPESLILSSSIIKNTVQVLCHRSHLGAIKQCLGEAHA